MKKRQEPALDDQALPSLEIEASPEEPIVSPPPPSFVPPVPALPIPSAMPNLTPAPLAPAPSTMRDLLETRMFRLHWGNQHAGPKTKGQEGGIVQANELMMEERIASILGEITDGNWEIKATLPITASEFSTLATQPVKSGSVFGTSFAAPFTDGVILLCQRQRAVDPERHAAIMFERQERQERILQQKRELFLRDNPVTEKRKLMGGRLYLFRGREYPTREAAEAVQKTAMDAI
jgi:hypothetical protein